MRKLLKAITVFLVATQLVVAASSQETGYSPQMANAPEELTAEDVYAYSWDQTIVTVSRREQKISEAPASITVITSNDIKRSGALNIFDLLRSVPGMDVVALTQSGPAISVRGFNSHLVSRTVLILLNGNPIYQEWNQSPMWTVLPITLSEIERIEIVRGPGSALWGANAFTGVINIITKAPEKLPPFSISQTAGELGTIYTNVNHAYKSGNLGYRLQYQHEQMLNVSLNPKELAMRRNIYTFDFRYKTAKQHELSSLFGYSGPRSAIMNSTFNMLDVVVFKQFLHLTYKVGETQFKVRQNVTKGGIVRQGSPYTIVTPLFADENVISAEVQTTKKLPRLGILTYGGEYKFVNSFILLPTPKRTQGLGSFFAQDDFTLNSKLSLITGARVDTHPQVKTAFSPRVSLMYRPAAKHTLRITGATAYRRPSYTELYSNGPIDIGFAPFKLTLTGNESVKSERIQSLEIGYVGRLSDRIKFSTTMFRNIMDNFIRMTFTGGKFVFMNRSKATQNGAEFELETFLTKDIKAFTNYALNETKDTSKTKNSPKGQQVEMSPRHKINAGLGWMPESGLYGNLVFNYVDDTGQTVGTTFQRAEAYRNWDLNMGYRFKGKLTGLELGVNAQNLFNEKRKEHPVADLIKRRVVGTVSYAF